MKLDKLTKALLLQNRTRACTCDVQPHTAKYMYMCKQLLKCFGHSIKCTCIGSKKFEHLFDRFFYITIGYV